MKFKDTIKKCFKNKSFTIGFIMVAFMLTVTIVGFFYLPYDPNAISVTESLKGFSADHLLGTDQLGRDVLSRLMKGARISFLIGFLVVVFGGILGTAIGGIAGYYGGMVDEVISKLIDTQMAFPGVLLALMLIAVFGSSVQNMILALGIMSIPRFARMSRSGFLKFRNAEFVKAAKARGASDFRIMAIHILPNISGELLVTATLSFAGAIMSEAGLSYLGLGIQPPNPSFGKMLSEAQDCILRAPQYVLVPAIAITILIMGFNLMGDGLQNITQN